jgi:hypothetical protein
MKRRDLLIAGGVFAIAPVLGPGIARADGTAMREFRILRGGSDIGRHRLAARRTGERFEIDIDIDIAVTFLGITAYRYELSNREVWDERRILRVASQVNDDGDRSHSKIERAGAALEVDGSGFSGEAPLEAVTTSYYARPFIERQPWISTQSGKVLDISIAREGEGAVQVRGELETELVYDDAGEWVGCRFDAQGEPGTYEVVESSGAILPLWTSA